MPSDLLCGARVGFGRLGRRLVFGPLRERMRSWPADRRLIRWLRGGTWDELGGLLGDLTARFREQARVPVRRRRDGSRVGPESLFSAVNSPSRHAPARDICGGMVHSRRTQANPGGGCVCEDGAEVPSLAVSHWPVPTTPPGACASAPRSRTGLGRTMSWSRVVGDAAPAPSQWSDGHCGPGTGGRKIRGRRLSIDRCRWNAQWPCR